ncbi:MAG: glycosyltransferase family 4 protein [Rhodothermales bacterium]|nr:glycosyltransferase family 4 protein [Rhodothermales bacterium]
MHIAYLADGQNYHVKKWVRAMADAGIAVTLITFRPPEQSIAGVNVIKLPIRIGNAQSYSYLNYVLSLSRVKAELSALQPDVLLGSYATHYGWLAARTRFHPFVLQTWTFDLTRYPFEGVRGRLWFGPIVRRSLGCADVITTDGPALAEIGRSLYPEHNDKIESVRWGIQTANFDISDAAKAVDRKRYSISNDTVVVTSPRGVLPVYQPEMLLQQFLKLLDANEQIVVVVLTIEHERTRKTEELLNELKKHGRALVFDRFLETEEMHAIWRVSDIVVSVPEADGISESVLEAMYGGSYPVLSDIPSNRSLVAEGVQGSLVTEDKPEALLKSILQVASDDTGRRDAQRKNRAWILDNACVEQTAEQVFRLFERVSRAD